MPLRKPLYRTLQQLCFAYWVSHLIFGVQADRQEVQAQKEAEKLVDWDYAGLHLINAIPIEDKLNYHNLCIMRRERQMYDPKRNISQSQEQYEVNEYRKLYNAVFSTKPPRLRTSEENYIQFLKDDFFRKQVEPSNPKTSRERYEWHVKKKQGSFFGGKYDFETYLAGNFTARRRRRSLDVAGSPNNGDNQISQKEQNMVPSDLEYKIKGSLRSITSKEVKQMKFEDNIANILRGIREQVEKKPVERGNNNKLNALENTLHGKQEKQAWSELQDKTIVHNIQLNEKKLSVDRDMKVALQTHVKEIKNAAQLNNIELDRCEGCEIENRPHRRITEDRKEHRSRPIIRSRRVRRELVNILHNPGCKPLNRSWQLDPRNPWNRNLRYFKHVKLFDAFYIDFYTREGSDRLPSNETFVKIRPPPGFHATKKPWSRAWDSQPVSYYVNEMEKLAKQLPKSSGKLSAYGMTSSEERRRERNRNKTEKIKEEELNWKKQISRLKLKLRKKNITQMEHDRLVDEIEKDKKLKYKLYKTRTTKHIVQKAMEQLTWAAEFVGSAIIREKREVQDMSSGTDDAIKNEFANGIDRSDEKPKMGRIRSKRVNRDIVETQKRLEINLDNARHIRELQKRTIFGNEKLLVRKKRFYPTYNPPTGTWECRKSFDYEPIARHNAVYYDESGEKTRPTTGKRRKTTVLTPEEIARRENQLKLFDEDMKNAMNFSQLHEENFMALKKSLNKERRKRESGNAKNRQHKILEIMSDLLDIKTYRNNPDTPAAFINVNVKSNQDAQISHIIGKLRKKRYTLEELLKGPVPDKFEQKKTKLEADQAEAAKKPDLKETVIEGTENFNKRIHNFVEGNVQDVNVDKNVNVNYNLADSRNHPDHPDNDRIDIYAYYEDVHRRYAHKMMKAHDYSLGIRERMHQDFVKARKDQETGLMDRGKLNRMELERAHRERMEFLRRQPLPTTTELEQRTEDSDVYSSFDSEPAKRGDKKKILKDELKERVKEMKALREGLL